MATSDENIEHPESMDPGSESSGGTSSGDAAQKPPDHSAGDGSVNMEFVLDIPLEVTVELGRTKMLINDMLKLGLYFGFIEGRGNRIDNFPGLLQIR